MIEFTLFGKYNTVIECCEKYISPRKYYLHNRVGGDGWEISPSLDLTDGFHAKVKIDDDKMATFLMLKFKH